MIEKSLDKRQSLVSSLFTTSEFYVWLKDNGDQNFLKRDTLSFELGGGKAEISRWEREDGRRGLARIGITANKWNTANFVD